MYFPFPRTNFATYSKTREMKTKILLSKDFCEMEAVKYVASRHGTTPEQILEHYFVQCGIITSDTGPESEYTLAPNEIALFHDLGVQPSIVEIL